MEGPPRDETNEALAAFGIAPDAMPKAEKPLVEVWPEHEAALRLFLAMQTQWRVGMGGPVGLDYGVLTLVAESIGIKPKDVRKNFADLQGIEREALAWMSEQHKTK